VKLLLLFLQEVVEEVLRPVVPLPPFLWITSLGKRRSQLSILLLRVNNNGWIIPMMIARALPRMN
jgi:hypothetical protein